MRVPLPGRDYFPPRVLLRGAERPMPERRESIPAAIVQAVAGMIPLAPMAQQRLPAAPPFPMMLRPACAA